MADTPLAVDLPAIAPGGAADTGVFNNAQAFSAILAPAVRANRETAATAAQEAAALKGAFGGDPMAAFQAAMASHVQDIDTAAATIASAKQRQYDINRRVPQELQAIAAFFGATDYDAAAQDVIIEQAANQVKFGQAKLSAIATATDEVAKRTALATQAASNAAALVGQGNAELRNIEQAARTRALQQLESMDSATQARLLKSPESLRAQFGGLIGPGDIQAALDQDRARTTALASAQTALAGQRLELGNAYLLQALTNTPDSVLEGALKTGKDTFGLKLGDGTVREVPMYMVEAARNDRAQKRMTSRTAVEKHQADLQEAHIEFAASTARLNQLNLAAGITESGDNKATPWLNTDPISRQKLGLLHSQVAKAYETGNFTVATELSKKLSAQTEALMSEAIKKLPEEQQAAAEEKLRYGQVKNHQQASVAMQSILNSATIPMPTNDLYFPAAETLRRAALDAQNKSNVLMSFGGPETKGGKGKQFELTRKREEDLQTFETMLTGQAGKDAQTYLVRTYENVFGVEALRTLGTGDTAAPAFKGMFVGGGKLKQEFVLGNSINFPAVVKYLANLDLKAGGIENEGSNVDLLLRTLTDTRLQQSVVQQDMAVNNSLLHDTLRTRLLNGDVTTVIPRLREFIHQTALQTAQAAKTAEAANYPLGYAYPQ